MFEAKPTIPYSTILTVSLSRSGVNGISVLPFCLIFRCLYKYVISSVRLLADVSKETVGLSAHSPVGAEAIEK